MTQRATLKPYLAEIRDWVAQGYTDVWIAHRLNSTPGSIGSFRREHGILRRDVPAEARGGEVPPPVLPPDAEEPQPDVKPKRRRRKKAEPEVSEAPVVEETAEGEGRKRRRRGGRGRSKRPAYEAVLDHGEQDGYGFWLDVAVRDDPVFAEHWSGRRALQVRIEADQIVIRPGE